LKFATHKNHCQNDDNEKQANETRLSKPENPYQGNNTASTHNPATRGAARCARVLRGTMVIYDINATTQTKICDADEWAMLGEPSPVQGN
jgi:hypothetical protein